MTESCIRLSSISANTDRPTNKQTCKRKQFVLARLWTGNVWSLVSMNFLIEFFSGILFFDNLLFVQNSFFYTFNNVTVIKPINSLSPISHPLLHIPNSSHQTNHFILLPCALQNISSFCSSLPQILALYFKISSQFIYTLPIDPHGFSSGSKRAKHCTYVIHFKFSDGKFHPLEKIHLADFRSFLPLKRYQSVPNAMFPVKIVQSGEFFLRYSALTPIYPQSGPTGFFLCFPSAPILSC